MKTIIKKQLIDFYLDNKNFGLHFYGWYYIYNELKNYLIN